MRESGEIGFYVDRHLFIKYTEMQDIIVAYIKARHVAGDLFMDIRSNLADMIDFGVVEEMNEDEKERSADNK